MVKYLRSEFNFICFEKSNKPYVVILNNKKTGNEVKIHFGGIQEKMVNV